MAASTERNSSSAAVVRVIATMASGLVGAGIGAATVAYLARAHIASPSAVSVTPPEHQATQSDPDKVTRSLITHLGNRLARLEERSGPGEAPSPGTFHEPPKHPTTEQSYERAKRLSDDFELRFSAESPDVQWARQTAADFQSDLQEFSAGRWTTVDVECAASLCKSKLRWPSYYQATASLMPLLVANFKKNCAVSVALPPPPEPAAPYDGKVFFDCTQDRASSTR
jgi:hypothetical protein